MPKRQPALWEEMRNAELRDPFCTVPESYAEMIRAVADAIPEQFYGASGVRAWLLEEAERADHATNPRN